MKDIIIIGSGPAGLSAAVYGRRAGLDILVIEKEYCGTGQIAESGQVDNYLGIPGIDGYSLGEKFRESDAYQKAKTIYGYLPYNQEVRTVAILAQALADGKQVAVPKVYGEDMKFILLPDLTRVSKGYAGIPEPIDDGPVATDTQALVLMPGLVFDKAGHRIGYGGGFYDRFLSREPDHPTVALCYDFQVMDRLETEEFDIPVDLVIWA